MKSTTLLAVLTVLAASAIAPSASAAPSVHQITKAVGTQRCGEATKLKISIVAPKGAHGTLRVNPVAAPSMAQNVSYTGNGTTVVVPVTLPSLGCDDIAGISLRLDDGISYPKWLMPEDQTYGVQQLGYTSTTHIERVVARNVGAYTTFTILLRGGTNGQNLTGTIKVKSVHSSPSGRSDERSSTYHAHAGQESVNTFGHYFRDGRTLNAFNVYLNGTTQPLVAKRVGAKYSL